MTRVLQPFHFLAIALSLPIQHFAECGIAYIEQSGLNFQFSNT
jgi:hypothetical protein